MSPDAAPDNEAPNASKVIPTDNLGPAPGGPQRVGGDDPHQRVYEEGREALHELSKDTQLKLPVWFKLGRGIREARNEAMRLTRTNDPTNRAYQKALSRILKREELGTDKIDSKTRGDLFKMMEHQPAIEKFLSERPPHQRILNHPSSILRAWRKTSAGSDAHLRMDKLLFKKRRQLSLQQQIDRLTDHLTEVEQERDRLKREADPQFGEPRLVALVRGGLRDEDLGDLTHEEWSAFNSRVRQIMDEHAGEQFTRLKRRVN